MALASGSQNDETLLNFVRWQADKSPFAADVQPAIGIHWVSAAGRRQVQGNLKKVRPAPAFDSGNYAIDYAVAF